MIYKPPIHNGKQIWVPIVVKSKDFLVGYVSGMSLIEDMLVDALQSNNIEIDLKGIDLCINSSRFNDILENDQREANCTEDELKKYYTKMVQNKINKVESHHPDNQHVFDSCFLEVECPCGLGIYSFKTQYEVPKENFNCQICGRTIIQYTGHDDDDYEYDGNLEVRKDTSVIDSIIEEFRNNEEGDDEYENG